MPKRKSRTRKQGEFRSLQISWLKVGLWLKRIVPPSFLALFLLLLGKGLLSFIQQAPYFSIRAVAAVSPFNAFRFQDQAFAESLLGDNLFQTSLPEIQRRLLEKHPELVSARVERVFPDRLRLEVVPRLPVAQVESGGYVLVDAEGVVLPFQSPLTQKPLPIIAGLREKLERLQVGYRPQSRGLAEALAFVAFLEKKPSLRRYIQTIDVGDYKNLAFVTPEGLEVRVGHGQWHEKLERFEKTFRSLGEKAKEVKYIDLRFDDVVVGTK